MLVRFIRVSAAQCNAYCSASGIEGKRLKKKEAENTPLDAVTDDSNVNNSPYAPTKIDEMYLPIERLESVNLPVMSGK